MLNSFGKVIENAPLKKYTTYKLLGTIDKVIYPENLKALKELLKYLKENKIKHMVIGNGSNLIIEENYNGVIIKLDNFQKLEIKENIVTVEAGYSLIKLAIKTANQGLKGLEFASGIPAQIGGAVYMNAGAYKSDMSDIIEEITILNENLEIQTLKNKDLNFSYRHSLLREKPYICLKAKLKLEYAPKEEILEIIKNRKQRRLETQPLSYPSAGSVFRNPENDHAGRLIENLGLKGMKIGGAKVSEKHANFIITKDAYGKDIIKLINLIKEKVKKEYKIDLITEQIIIK